VVLVSTAVLVSLSEVGLLDIKNILDTLLARVKLKLQERSFQRLTLNQEFQTTKATGCDELDERVVVCMGKLNH
jgi:hypothetical protein